MNSIFAHERVQKGHARFPNMCKPLPRHSHFHTFKLYANASRFFFRLFTNIVSFTLSFTTFVNHHLCLSPPMSITTYVFHHLCLITFVYHRLCLSPPLSFTISVYHHLCLSPPFIRHLPPRHLSPPNSPLRLITISISSLRFISKCSQLLGH